MRGGRGGEGELEVPREHVTVPATPKTLLQGACSPPVSPEARAGHPTPYLAAWAHPPGEATGTPDGTPLPWPPVPRRGQVNLLSRKISALLTQAGEVNSEES